MKLNTKEKTLIVGGAAEIIPMTINQSAKGFRALMSGLYSDPIQSLIREISTNAYDAHVEAGIPHRPFLVHLPTQTDRRFRVRDYGRSIKHDAMRRIYTSVLSSTKDEDNTQVGAWGLGSKSPLAYVDSFIVTTYSGTETRSYLVATGTDGSPQLVCYDPEPSTEESGVEVIIDVSPKDVSTFAMKASFVYRGFPVVPEGITIPARKTGESFVSGRSRIERSDTYYNEKRLNILQGCVLYPVDLNKVRSVTPLPEWMGELTVEVPIGSVDITPSRENIIYERGTCIRIATSVNTVIELLDDEISNKIAASKNMWEASKALHRVTSLFGIGRDAKWNGKKIPRRLELGAKVSEMTIRRAQERYRFGRNVNSGKVTISRSSLEVGSIDVDEFYNAKQVFVADILTRDIRSAIEAKYDDIGDNGTVLGFLTGEDYISVVDRLEEFGVPVVGFKTSSVPKAAGACWRPMFGCLVSNKTTRWSKQPPDELKPLEELLKKHPDAPVLVTNSWEPPGLAMSMLALCGKAIVTTVRNSKAVEGRKTLQEAAAERAQEILDAGWPADDTIIYAIDRKIQSLLKNLRTVDYQSEFLSERKDGGLFKDAAIVLGRDYQKLVRASKRAEGLIALQKRYPLISHLYEYDVVSKLKNDVLEYIEDCDKRRPE